MKRYNLKIIIVICIINLANFSMNAAAAGAGAGAAPTIEYVSDPKLIPNQDLYVSAGFNANAATPNIFVITRFAKTAGQLFKNIKRALDRNPANRRFETNEKSDILYIPVMSLMFKQLTPDEAAKQPTDFDE